MMNKGGDFTLDSRGLSFNEACPLDAQIEIAERFSNMLDGKTGWFVATITFKVEDGGKVSRLVESKVVPVGSVSDAEAYPMENKYDANFVEPTKPFPSA